MSTINVNISFMDLRTNKKRANDANQVYIDKHPHFQRQYQEWNDELKTRFIETILIGRAMNPIWTISNPVDHNEVVLDGMHRMTLTLDFLNDKFKINAKYLSELNKTDYDKKSFNNLSTEIQQKFRNYNFTFNILGPEYNEPNKRQAMFEILNRTSKPLNDFEFQKGIYGPFFNVIGESMHIFKNTFLKQDNNRGRLHEEIIDVMLMSENLPTTWSSVTDLRNKYYDVMLGKTEESVRGFMQKNSEDVKNKIKNMKEIISLMNDKKMFETSSKDLNTKHLPLKFMIGRVMFRMKKDSDFIKKYGSPIIDELNSKIMSKDLKDVFEFDNRNSDFQKKVITCIDDVIQKAFIKSLMRLKV